MTNFFELGKRLVFLTLCDYITRHTMKTPTKQQILQQIAAMERGKLSTYSFPDRTGHPGPYHKLQHWQAGRNHTRYIPAADLPAVEAAVAGYAQYEQLTRQYADLVIAETRQRHAGPKKSPRANRRPSPSRGNPTVNGPV
ncbi:MAG: hypothetical protein Q7U75_19265 [Desulfobacterales bacterium]|nr:hypothetical protein [Desulfobacterales bacterium]